MEAALEFLEQQGTKSWVNTQVREFAQAEQQQPVDVKLYTLLRKLELLAEDTEAAMQATSMHLVRAMPQAVRDLDQLQDAAAELHGSTDDLSRELRELETQSNASLGMLVEAEHVKKRMLSVALTLEQASQLTQTLASAEASISRGEVSSAASQLGKTRTGLAALEHVPRFRDARTKIDKLSDALLAELQQRLAAALHDEHAPATRECVEAYAQLGKLELVDDVFVQTRQGPLYQRWNQHAHAGKGELFAPWLRSFQGSLVHWARAELDWAASAGVRRRRLLVCRLLTETLTAIAPQCAQRMLELAGGAPEAGAGGEAGGAADGEGERSRGRVTPERLTAQLELSEHAREWAALLVAEVAPATESSGPGSSDGEEAERALRQAVELPFARVRASYGRLESAMLAAQLSASALGLPASGSPPALVGALVEALPLASAALDAALARCARLCRLPAASSAAGQAALTESRASVALLCAAIDASYAELGARLGALVAQLARSLGLAPAAPPQAPPPGTDQTAAQPAPGKQQASGPAAVALATQGWAHFREAMQLLAALHAHTAALAALSRRLAQLGGGGGSGSGGGSGGGSGDGGGGGEAGAEAGVPASVQRARAVLAQALALALDVAFAPIGARLRQLHASAAWAAGGLAGSAPFSASAQGYMTAVGEHLLLLPQAIEPFAHGGALCHADGNDAPAAGSAQAGAQQRTGGGDEDGGGAADAGAVDTDAVVSWLAVLAGRTVDDFLGEAALIRLLSASGERQLSADLAYLRMVLSSGLGLEPDARLVELEAALADGEEAHSDGDRLAALGRAREHVPAELVRALLAARAAHGPRGAGSVVAAASSAFEI